MNYEEQEFFSKDNAFLRSLTVAVVKTAQAISSEADGPRKVLAGQILDNPTWGRNKFAVNVASQSGVNTLVTPVWNGGNISFTYPANRTAFDTALDSACSAVWNAEAKVPTP
jgi:hypothetical protein